MILQLGWGPPPPVDLYAACWSIRRIALFHGRSYHSVRDELSAAGIAFRPRAAKGTKLVSAETRARYREVALTNPRHATRGKRGAAHPNYGKRIHTEERRRALAAQKTGTSLPAETRARQSASMLRWYAENGPRLASPDAARRWSLANNVRPNRQELRLGELLELVAPGRYRCNVHAETTINGKIPDFVDDPGRIAIELYGDYWHRNDDPQDRIDLFAQHGWRTLVIWESELRDPDAVADRVREVGR